MKNLILPAVIVALVISNNVNFGVNGIEGDTDLNDLKDTVKKKIESLPIDDIPNIDQLNSSIPSLEEGMELMKEKCLKNSANNNSFELVKVSISIFDYISLLF
ncbi:uncharacterized protein LOC126910174 [Daktulosphaira vitifoliae]|uniref:uncharacterized protein LOC126910174 n=1 Tax=Daktulosphaira vitifoliae TaxID=58002 RepID=UPI0021AA838B|nr:uncharacterized protein LOC126910174 [Daktulosphaira vitifoliae]